ncbi:hypothetical protein ACFX13_036369 [Malus domestica]
MRNPTSVMSYVDAADDKRIPGLQLVQVEPVPDPKRQEIGRSGGSWSLVDLECRAHRGASYGSARLAMNSNFGSFSDSNWGSSSNSKLEEKWAQMRQNDEESDEEVQVMRNKQNIVAAMVAAMVCQPTDEQSQWVYTKEDFRRRFRMRRHAFEHLLRDVQQVNPYLRQKRD